MLLCYLLYTTSYYILINYEKFILFITIEITITCITYANKIDRNPNILPVIGKKIIIFLLNWNNF